MASCVRRNNSSKVSWTGSVPFAEGGFKFVYKGTYTAGQRKGQDCVVKVFKTGSVFESSYFESELEIVDRAANLVEKFNKNRFVDKKIWVNEPQIFETSSASHYSRFQVGEKILVEPFIKKFQKFNSNSGWTPRERDSWDNAMQALSHFSYHASGGQFVLCDLQGGIYADGFIITDPVILSRTQRYGPTDLGSDGIETFFHRHNCTKFCKDGWQRPRSTKAHYPCKMGSTMELPTRDSREYVSYQNHSRPSYGYAGPKLGILQEQDEYDDYY